MFLHNSLKAILLAGGHGTRAKPFTDYFPKAMIPIGGRPVIDHVVRYLAKFSQISDLIILCEFDNMGKQIINYFEGKEAVIGKPLTFVEDKKQGTGGALLKIEREVRADEHFLVWFVDNLCAISIDDLMREYNGAYKMTNGGITGLMVVRKQRLEETGRVILDNADHSLQIKNNNNNKKTFLIKQFIEKGVVKLEQPEAIGIYLFNNNIFEYLHRTSENMQGGIFNLSHDLLERISTIDGELYSYILDEDKEWLDLESPSYADRHKDIVEKILLQMDMAAIQHS
ncbi:MAG: nucleotidyltransferase family protein [Candidatus Nitrosopolaris sp.]